MSLEELAFGFQSGTDGFALVDIPLTTVHDGHVAQPEWDDTTSEDIDNISTDIPTTRPQSSYNR